jgi:1-phosphofructokinase
MIYTVTFNPSLDYVIRVTEFEPGNLHRTETEELYVGGKGINVTAVLKQLGIDSSMLGFVAGFTGREITERLAHMGLSADFITVGQGLSRINIKLKSDNKTETEINGQGPVIEASDLEKLYRKLDVIGEDDILVLSGSVPKQIPDRDHIYERICSKLADRKIKLVVDAEGSLLMNTLRYHPFLIKPNLHELGALFGQILLTEESIIDCAMRLKQEGAQNVLVSMAGEGALLIDSNGRITRQNAPKGKVLNSVGAGDALIAGFLAGLIKSGEDGLKESYTREDYEYALKFSVASGSAAAFTEGLPDNRKIEKTFRSL